MAWVSIFPPPRIRRDIVKWINAHGLDERHQCVFCGKRYHELMEPWDERRIPRETRSYLVTLPPICEGRR